MKKIILVAISTLIICGIANAKKSTETNLISQTDTVKFIDCLKKNGQEPQKFILDKLKNHKLVIYGEIHKRKASWDLLKSIIKEPSFSKNTGIVFLEIGHDNQEKMDQFFSNKKMNKEILLEIFRNGQMQGWDDKGMYEFVIDLWNLNKKLPKKRRIKVILADISRPWDSLKTNEDFIKMYKSTPDRNQHSSVLPT